MKKEWVDFKAVKDQVTMEMVLDHYQVNWLRKTGDELRGRCPIHQGEGERAFHVNLEKNIFHCFSCGAKGNVLGFVEAMGKVSTREAGLLLKEWFGVGESVVGRKPRFRQPEKRSETKTAGREKQPEIINPALGFQLKVNVAHEYGLKRGLHEETLKYFGAGLCLSRGLFAGRFVIPLHDETGQLVGYAGRSIDEKEPKYLFPSAEKGFHKKYLLFNLHRVVKEFAPIAPVVVVEGFFDCMKVKQAGYPCVAILGSSLSKEQEELLWLHLNSVVLLFDGDDAGKEATEDCLRRLARRVFAKAIDLEKGQQPDMLTEEELHSLI